VNDDTDLSTELDAAEEIVMGRVETVRVEWGVRRLTRSGVSGNLRYEVFACGYGEDGEKLARAAAADHQRVGNPGALRRRTVTYTPWEELPGA
jgi:hypothetical protein